MQAFGLVVGRSATVEEESVMAGLYPQIDLGQV